MRIIDQHGDKITDYDASKGYLAEETILKEHHEAVEACEETGHFVTIAEYPNGGKDVEWVVETPAVEAKEAYDEYETVLRYVPYTEKELAEMRVSELKSMLQATDYNIIKMMEGAKTQEECSEIISHRAEWRQEINELEGRYGLGTGI